MTRTKLQVAELSAVLVLRLPKPGNPYWAATDACKLSRIATDADRNATDLCNGHLEQAEYDERQEKLFTRANVLLQRYHLRAEVGGDPRGYCLKIFSTKAPALRGNTMGGDEAGRGV